MKNKKILIITLFLILFCLLGYSKSFAAPTGSEKPLEGELDSTYFNKITSFMKDNDFNNYFITYSNYLYNCNIITFINSPDDTVFYEAYDSSFGYYKVYSNKDVKSLTFRLSSFYSGDYDDNYIKNNTQNVIKDNKSIITGISGKRNKFFYSSVDIYDTNKIDVLFQETPLVSQKVVAQAVEKVEMSQALQEVIAILPMTLVVLVSLVGLRKGLKMLETFLRQS